MKDGGPAFPEIEVGYTIGGDSVIESQSGGMSLRDYFAAHADVSDFDFGTTETAAEWMGEDPPDTNDIHAVFDFSFRVLARIRYKLADAMLEARKDE